jgi:hypothetical protein
MSLAIDLDDVTAVLLADGWHEVAGESFTLDAYEFMWRGQSAHSGGSSGVCSTGFAFKTPAGEHLAGPLTAVLAVRQTPED